MDETDMMLAAQGDATAFGRIVLRHQDRLIGWIENRCRGQGEDIAQEVFIKCWLKAPYYKSVSFAAWMYTIARNLLIDRSRKKARIPASVCFAGEDDDEAGAEPPEGRAVDPVVSAEHRDELERVYEAMQDIVQEQRETLEAYSEGWSMVDVAEMHGCSLHTTKSRRRLAREKIIAAMHDRELCRLVTAAFE